MRTEADVKQGACEGTYFQGTYFQGTYFQGTYFKGTYFQGTYFQGTYFLDFKEHTKCLTYFEKDNNDEKVKWLEACLFQVRAFMPLTRTLSGWILFSAAGDQLQTLSWYSCTQDHSVTLLPNTGIYRSCALLG